MGKLLLYVVWILVYKTFNQKHVFILCNFPKKLLDNPKHSPWGFPFLRLNRERSKNIRRELSCWTASWLNASIVLSVSVALNICWWGRLRFHYGNLFNDLGVKSTIAPNLINTILYFSLGLCCYELNEGEHLLAWNSMQMFTQTYCINILLHLCSLVVDCISSFVLLRDVANSSNSCSFLIWYGLIWIYRSDRGSTMCREETLINN